MTSDIALMSILSALWVTLNLTVAPLSFALTSLPMIHAFIVYFIFLLTVWAIGKFGAAILVSVLGTIIVLFAGGPLPVLGFAVSSVVFDVILLANRHRLAIKHYNIAITILATLISVYIASNLNGLLIIKLPLEFSVTIWSAWNILGSIVSLLVTFPIIELLEKAMLTLRKLPISTFTSF